MLTTEKQSKTAAEEMAASFIQALIGKHGPDWEAKMKARATRFQSADASCPECYSNVACDCEDY